MKISFRNVYIPDQPCASFYNDARTYREFTPSPALENCVFCYWTSPPNGLAGENVPPPTRETIVPDACIDIVFNMTSDGVTSSIAGPFDIPFSLPVDLKRAKDFGVRFLLPDFFIFTGISPISLINGSFNACDLFGSEWKTVEELVLSAKDDLERVRILDARLPRFSKPAIKHESLMTGMFDSVFGARGHISAQDIAASSGISLRHLNRICAVHTGFNVKTIARIIRFQSFIRDFRSASGVKFSDAAVDAGFSDQSHMIREFRSFTGMTPAILR